MNGALENRGETIEKFNPTNSMVFCCDASFAAVYRGYYNHRFGRVPFPQMADKSYISEINIFIDSQRGDQIYKPRIADRN